ncbi:TPA: recombinase family protein [Acinetobacter baumannii]|uniref:recombinase family protein n=1 Tax=Acinetobacter TaxID=469 RepID=UPI000DE75508|nr:Resolvase, N terminal domain [Acinetobacter baumannii]
MFIRAYLRASTKEQDANRAKDELIAFAREHGHKIAAFYTESESGATGFVAQRFEMQSAPN